MTRTLCVVVAVLGLTSIVALGQAKSDLKMLAGTWKLNVEKSKYTPGPGPKSQTLTWKTSATGFDFTVDSVTADGKTTEQRASGNVEGKPYPLRAATFSGMRTTKWVDAFKLRKSIPSMARCERRERASFPKTARYSPSREKV